MSADQPKKSGRGGKREPKDGKKLGRPKQQRPTNANVASRVLATVKAEETWVQLVNLEKERLGLNLPPIPEKAIMGPYSVWRGNVSIIPLTNLLKYLECRALGNPTDTVNHVHDKAIDVNVTHTLSERMKLALQKAEDRVRNRHS